MSILAGTTAAKVIGNTMRGNLGEQLFIENSDGNLVENNFILGVPINPNLDSDGGVLIRASADNIIRGGEIRDTGDAGIVIDTAANNNTVENVVMYRNGDAGVIVYDSTGTTMSGITAHQESDGGVVLTNAHGSKILDSDLRFNPSGVEHNDSNDVLIQGNDASDSLATGIEVGNGLNILVINNLANRTGGSGIGVEGAAFDPVTGAVLGGAIIEGNTTNENGEAGISVTEGGHTITANKAYHNADHGIVAADSNEPTPPTELPAAGRNIDGGGNMAAGNGTTPADPGNPQEPPPLDFEQCIGVVCTAGQVPLREGHADLEPPNTRITQASGPDRPGGRPRPSSSRRPTTGRRSRP